MYSDISDLSELEQQPFFAQSAVPVLIIEPYSGRILSANQAAADFYGYSREELSHFAVTALNTLPSNEIKTLIQKAMNNNSNHFTVIHRLADGSLRNVDILSWPIQHEGQVYLSSIVHDVTDREQIKAELVRNAEQMRRAEEIADIGYWTFHLESGEVIASEGTRRIYGTGDRDLTIRMVQSQVDASDRPMMDRAMENLLAGDDYDVRFRLNRFDTGEQRYIRSMAEYDPDSRTVFGTLHDITDQTLAAMQLQNRTRMNYLIIFLAATVQLIIIARLALTVVQKKAAEKKIKSMVKEKDMLLREVHHRIKNNMATIANLLSLQSGMVESPDAARALDEAHGRVRSMLLIYERLYQSEAYGQISIRSYLESLAEEIEATFFERARISINLDIVDFSMDASRLFYLGILVNELLTNAVKYAFPGERSGNISIRASLSGKKASLQISDDGVGFPEGFNKEQDSGFGLTLVDIITEQLNAESSFDVQNGTRFSISFIP